MLKAKYLGKTYGTGYDRDSVYLRYEYRGHEYEVHENRAKGNEPLAWQHRSAQDLIDRNIAISSMPKTEHEYCDPMEALDLLYDDV